jgi:hypothetical protein
MLNELINQVFALVDDGIAMMVGSDDDGSNSRQ